MGVTSFLPRALRFNQRRFVSSMFGLTFITSVLTVSAASTLLPCPTRDHRARYADEGESGSGSRRIGTGKGEEKVQVTVVKRPSRWIEERHPL